MISSSTITSGYAAKLPAITGKTFSFTPGLNILFGPNGCGKTSILRVTAAYAGCSRRGWSSPVGDNGRRLLDSDTTTIPYPRRFSLAAPGRCEASVAWDGVPTLLHTVEVASKGMFSDHEDEFTEQLRSIMDKPSAGQLVISMLLSLKKYVNNVPDITDTKQTWFINEEYVSLARVNSTWEEYITSFIAYVQSLPAPAEKRVTVFLDEPDKALSIPTQHLLWTKLLPRLAETFQVITASHSIFALLAPQANLIEMQAGYVAECVKCAESIRALGIV